MKSSVPTALLLEYLQELLTEYIESAKEYGCDDRVVKNYLHQMIGCKEMVEIMIGEPVNLGKDGVVSVGF